MVCNKGFDGSVQGLVKAIDGRQETKPMGSTMVLGSRGRQGKIINKSIDTLQDVQICRDQT